MSLARLIRHYIWIEAYNITLSIALNWSRTWPKSNQSNWDGAMKIKLLIIILVIKSNTYKYGLRSGINDPCDSFLSYVHIWWSPFSVYGWCIAASRPMHFWTETFLFPASRYSHAARFLLLLPFQIPADIRSRLSSFPPIRRLCWPAGSL